MEPKVISGKVLRFCPDRNGKPTSDNVDSFLTMGPTNPMILLFSNRKFLPAIFKD